MLAEIASQYHFKVAEYERNYCVNGSPSFFCEFFAVAQHARKALREAQQEAASYGFTREQLQKEIAMQAPQYEPYKHAESFAC